MAFTEKMAAKLVPDENTFQLGKAYYVAGRVKEIKKDAAKGGTTRIEALIKGAQEYKASFTVNKTGTYMFGVSCNCPSFRPDGGYCLHVAAALLAFANDKDEDPAEISDEAALRLLELFRPAAPIVSDMPGEIRLVPILDIDADRLTLEVQIGARQFYPVMNLTNLCQQVQSGTTVSYGKKLTFRHSQDAFEPRSGELMHLIRDLVRIRAFHTGQDSGSGFYEERALPFPPEFLDRFFLLYEGETVKFREGPLLLTSAPPNVEFLLRSEQDGMVLSVPEFRVFSGETALYLLYESALHRMSTELLRPLSGLRDAAASGAIFFKAADLPAFCSFILPVLQTCGTASDPEGILKAYTPEIPELKIMLDTTDANTLTAAVSFAYESIETDPFDDTPPQAFRNLRLESEIVNLVRTWFPEEDPPQREYVLRGTDEQLYGFLVDGLPLFADNATLLCTDRFEGIHRTRPRINVGVSVNSGLLELMVESSEFPISELENVLASCRLKKRFHRLKNGVFLELEGDALRGLRELDETVGLASSDIHNGVIRLPGYRAMEVDRVFGLDSSAAFSRSSGFREMIRDFKSAETNEFAIPDEMEGILRPYQKQGFRWLKTLDHYGFGGILADDMGLGKTIQMISFLMSAHMEQVPHPALIVCPASLVLNWQDEFSRFAPMMSVLAVSGTSIYRRLQLNEAENYDVLITSYDMLKRDVDQYELMTFSYCILDEAQYIKNHNTKSFQAARRIHAGCRFALTGTPVENRLSELWSIFDFLMPGYLSAYARFRDRFELPILKNGDEEAANRLGEMIAPFVLRRMKKEVLTELPPKTETVQYAIMSSEQRKLYDANVYDARQKLSDSDQDHIQILAALTRLRQICCDPRLCAADYEAESAKLELCMQLVNDAVASGHQLLLFSQFTSMLALIEEELKAAGITYFVLEGSTTKPKRAELVKRFNAGEVSVFLISLKAGGTGLNLTAADIVIHYDPWWNLAAQNQATDRTHRIGQQNAVQVYQLIIKDSIEERILNLQAEKGALAESIIAFGNGGITSMSKEDLLSLLEDT